MINASEADWFHIDDMDVGDLFSTFYGAVLAAINKHATKETIDVHLMIVDLTFILKHLQH
jgi:ribulose-phosphate 3-epimerase